MPEPFVKSVTRATIAALLLGAVLLIALPRHGSLVSDFVDVFTVAFCFTFFGHYVERMLLALPDIHVGVGRVVRVAGWFAGGLWCYVVGRWLLLLYGRDTQVLPPLLYGGFIFVALEFVLHGLLQAAGKPNFFSGQAAEP